MKFFRRTVKPKKTYLLTSKVASGLPMQSRLVDEFRFKKEKEESAAREAAQAWYEERVKEIILQEKRNQQERLERLKPKPQYLFRGVGKASLPLVKRIEVPVNVPVMVETVVPTDAEGVMTEFKKLLQGDMYDNLKRHISECFTGEYSRAQIAPVTQHVQKMATQAAENIMQDLIAGVI